MGLLAFSLVLGSLAGVDAPPLRAACNQIVTFADGLAPTNELHVAVDGSDESGDGSPQAPYGTIGFAVSRASAGTAVVVHAGTYPGGIYEDNVAGTATAPIWIGGAAGEQRPVVAGGAGGIHFSRAKYVVLHDLEISGAASNGINCDDGGDYADPLAAHHVIFQRLYLHDIGSGGNNDGLKLSGLNDFFVLDCRISQCSDGSGIDMVGCHRGLIAGCTLEALTNNAVQCKGGSEDIEIRWCRIRNAGHRGINMGGSTGFEYFRPPLSDTQPNYEARNLRVLANVFEGSDAPVAFVGCVDSVAANNTIINPQRWIIRILQETTSAGGYEFLPCGDNRFENNLVYFNRSALRTDVNIGPNTASETFAFANNLWFAHDDPGDSAPDLPAAESGGIYGMDPLLFDAAAGDYRVGPESPAAGAGLSPALAAGDIRGRCYRQPPSIGAYEALSGGASHATALLLLLGE